MPDPIRNMSWQPGENRELHFPHCQQEDALMSIIPVEIPADRYILHPQRDGKFRFVIIIQHLKQPKTERYEYKEQKNQKFPTLLGEQKTSDFLQSS